MVHPSCQPAQKAAVQHQQQPMKGNELNQIQTLRRKTTRNKWLAMKENANADMHRVM